jgi:uroporphyrinogen decarboxylase
MSANDLFQRAARGEITERTPVWLMRQAGRTDPAYIALKERAGLPLEDLFRHPELAAEISLLPKRLGVDAIIYFQDILTPLTPIGAHFVFAPGPKLAEPIRSTAQIDALTSFDPAMELPFIGETFRLLRESLDGELPVLGFAGAPMTLAVFMIEGGSFAGGETALQFMAEEPAAFHRLLEKLTDMTVDYLKYQAEVGAVCVQLFESAANIVDMAQYREFGLPYQQRIFEAMGGVVPTIMFAREWDDVESLGEAGADIVSLPSTISIKNARDVLGDNQVVQGNLDNGLLARGSLEEIEVATRSVIKAGGHRGHIFNLSHGLLRDTPYENVQHVVRVARETRVR